MDHIPQHVVYDMVMCLKELRALCSQRPRSYFARRSVDARSLLREFDFGGYDPYGEEGSSSESKGHECSLSCFTLTGWLEQDTIWFACRFTGRLHRCTEHTCNAALLLSDERLCPLTHRAYPLYEQTSTQFGRPNEVTDAVSRQTDANPTTERKRARDQTAVFDRMLSMITTALIRCSDSDSCDCCSAYATVTPPTPLVTAASHANRIWQAIAEFNAANSKITHNSIHGGGSTRRANTGAQTYKYEYHILVVIMHTRTGFKHVMGRRRFVIVAEDKRLARHLPPVADLLARIKPRENKPPLEPRWFTQSQNRFAAFIWRMAQERGAEFIAGISQQIETL